MRAFRAPVKLSRRQPAPRHTPPSGPSRLIFAFEAVISGGLGSLWGTLAAGVILGVAQALGAAWD